MCSNAKNRIAPALKAAYAATQRIWKPPTAYAGPESDKQSLLQWIKDIGASLADVNAIASDSPSLSTERYTESPGSWVVVNAGAAAKGIKAVSMCSKLAGHIRYLETCKLLSVSALVHMPRACAASALAC